MQSFGEFGEDAVRPWATPRLTLLSGGALSRGGGAMTNLLEGAYLLHGGASTAVYTLQTAGGACAGNAAKSIWLQHAS